MRPGAQPPPSGSPARSLFSSRSAPALLAHKGRRPAARTQQRPREGLESKCTHACAPGRGVWGHVLDVHVGVCKGKATEYTSGSNRCQVYNWDVCTC